MMKTFAIASVFVSLCVFIHASPNEDFVKCAREAWEKMDNTFSQDSYTCIADEDYKISEVIDIIVQIGKIGSLTAAVEQFYIDTPECGKKYKTLYDMANNVMQEIEVLPGLVQNKTDKLKNCIAKVVEKANSQVDNAAQCLKGTSKSP